MGDRIEAGTFLMACGIAGGEIELEGVRLEHLEMVVIEARRDGHARVADARAASGRRPPSASSAVGHRDAAVPRVRDGLHADGRRAARRERGHFDRHGERLRQPLLVRRRAGADGRRRADRGPLRRGPGRRTPLRCPGAGARRPSGRGAGSRRARRRRGARSCTTGTTSSAPTPTSSVRSARSAPTSSASELRRADTAHHGEAGLTSPGLTNTSSTPLVSPPTRSLAVVMNPISCASRESTASVMSAF